MAIVQRGDVIDDRYEVEALIGEGGLAEVYRVRHLELGSQHALKFLRLDHRSLAERLLLEGRIQAQLRHPNVVTVTDVVRHRGKLGLLMEYVDNVALDIWLHERGAPPLDDALELFASVVSGVVAAHDAGVLHRDLKPANILLARAPDGGVVPKVTDFGLAKVVADEFGTGTIAGTAMGTPGYMAPEQVLDSKRVDQRADVFALGAILYELIAGQPAFRAEDGTVAVRSTLDGVFEPLDEVAPGVPPSIAQAVSRALAGSADDRFGDVRAFGEAVFGEHPALLRRLSDASIAAPITLHGRPASSAPDTTLPPRPAPKTTPPPMAAAPTMLPDDDQGPTLLPPPATSRRPLWVVAAVAGVVGAAIAGVILAATGAGTPGDADPAPERHAAGDPAESEPPTPAAAPAPAPVVVDTPAAAPAPVVASAPAPAPQPVQAPIPEPSDAGDGDLLDALAASGGGSAGAPGAPEPAVEPAPEPEVAGVEPAIADAEPDVADAEPDVSAAEPDVAEPEPAPAPSLLGTWSGEAAEREFVLRITGQDRGILIGEGKFFLGPTQRIVALSGTVDFDTGAVDLADAEGAFRLTGTWSGSTMRGEYRRSGQRRGFEWTVTRSR